MAIGFRKNGTGRAPRIGLVLGGGGIAGYSYHAGVLGALADATGWDPRTAEIIVGTSAGSGVAAMIRGNVAIGDLVERILSVPTDPVGMDRLRQVSGRGQVSSIAESIWFGPSSPALMVREVFRLHRLRPLTMVAGALPAGRIATTALGEQAEVLHDGSWPDRETWITAVSLDDGELTVFGRDNVAADIADAVAASCAIPGFFRPVKINGRRYVDGGVRSMVNLDLLADLDLDLVVVSSPMSMRGLTPRHPLSSSVRGLLKLQLKREVRQLFEADIPTLVMEPDRSVIRATGINPMDPTCMVPVLVAATATAAEELHEPEFDDALNVLTEAGRRLPSPADVPYPD